LAEGLRGLLEGWDAFCGDGEKEWREEPGREVLVRLLAATGDFNTNKTEEVLGELERYRYEKGGDFIIRLREQAENFDYDVMHKELEEFLGNS
jgi:hypothetical protein